MDVPSSPFRMEMQREETSCGTWAWQWLLGVGVLLLVASCDSGPNRIEILQHKKEILTERTEKDKFFKTSPNSPLLTEQQMNFKELSYYPVDIAYRASAKYNRLEKPVEFRIQTSTGHERVYITIGQLNFSLAGKPYSLFTYQEKGPDANIGKSLFVPFTDLTTGRDTYGAGRYLDISTPVGDTVVLDFNVAYNPYCAYNYNFSCPIPPPENRLDIEIKAGEKLFPLNQPVHQ